MSFYGEFNAKKFKSEDDIRRHIYETAKTLSKIVSARVLVDKGNLDTVILSWKKYGVPLCPCTSIARKEAICPCKGVVQDLLIRGECFCGLFYIHPEDLKKINLREIEKLNKIFGTNIRLAD